MLSPRDYFLKAAKVFCADCARAKAVLAKAGVTALVEDTANRCLEFPVSAVRLLAERWPLMEVAITFCIAEEREEGPLLRELALALTTAAGFDPENDF
ncbi:MAG: hypothetical protein IKD70_02645 [Eggerthellaceae bacterium]|nr:hypothetical protein [Eggerthellaceae bacterium]